MLQNIKLSLIKQILVHNIRQGYTWYINPLPSSSLYQANDLIRYTNLNLIIDIYRIKSEFSENVDLGQHNFDFIIVLHTLFE